MNAEEILRRAAVVTRFTFRRRVTPPAEPPFADLLAESKERMAAAYETAAAMVMESTAPLNINDAREGSATRFWPDPYGLDPVVFGTVPLVRGN